MRSLSLSLTHTHTHTHTHTVYLDPYTSIRQLENTSTIFANRARSSLVSRHETRATSHRPENRRRDSSRRCSRSKFESPVGVNRHCAATHLPSSSLERGGRVVPVTGMALDIGTGCSTPGEDAAGFSSNLTKLDDPSSQQQQPRFRRPSDAVTQRFYKHP